MIVAPGSLVTVRTDLAPDALRQAALDDFEAAATRRRCLPGERRLDDRGFLASGSDVSSPDVNDVARSRYGDRGDAGGAMLAGREAGLRIATLQGSDSGRGVCERIGVHEPCRFRLFEWGLRPGGRDE